MERFGVHEQEREVLMTIKYLRNHGNTFEAIANRLNAQMVPSKCGRKWVPALVRNILENKEVHTLTLRKK